MYLRLSIILFFVALSNFGYGQDEVNILLSQNKYSEKATVQEIIDEVESKLGVSFSYSSSFFDLQKKVDWQSSKVRFKDLLEYNFPENKFSFEKRSSIKYLIIVSYKQSITISGFVKDEVSGEVLSGAIVSNSSGGDYSFTDDKGYYFIQMPIKDTVLYYQYLGYEEGIYNISQLRSHRHDINLKFKNTISPILIHEDLKDLIISDPFSEKVSLNNLTKNRGIVGESDVIQSIKSMAGTTAGGEAQNGLFVQGGSADQNLFLLDGMPLYEVSHIGGLSSIFIDETIRSVDFIKSGMPARYNGRLSSVVNISLKDGNISKSENAIEVGLTGGKFTTQGPIFGSKTTYNFGGRFSWITPGLKLLDDYITLYDEVNIGYNDMVFKLAHRFSNSQKLTFSTYIGNDNLSLSNSNIDAVDSVSTALIKEQNRVGWRNQVYSLNYDMLLNDKTKINLQAGILSYTNSSRGQYTSDLLFTQDTIENFVDVVAYSSINDYQLSGNVKHYLNDNINIVVGGKVIQHDYNPTVRQSLIETGEEIEELVERDSSFNALESNFYVEGRTTIGQKFTLYPGLTATTFNFQSGKYSVIQPRLMAIYLPDDKTLISAAYTEAVQYSHLLTNPGLGLPSDLWVPSTQEVLPETVTSFNVGIKRTFPYGLNFSANWFSKQYENLVEYSVPVDLFVNLIDDNSDLLPVLTSHNAWTENIELGTGRSVGWDVSLARETGRVKFWTNITYARSYRTFQNINEGEEFLARYDRPWSVSSSCSYEYGDNWDFGAAWSYASGSTFSLSIEEFDSPLGIKLLSPSGRNNFRLPAFHQLSISGTYRWMTSSGIKCRFNFGLYNVYNRLNPFYIYATRDPDFGNNLVLNKVSLYPILPQISFTLNW